MAYAWSHETRADDDTWLFWVRTQSRTGKMPCGHPSRRARGGADDVGRAARGRLPGRSVLSSAAGARPRVPVVLQRTRHGVREGMRSGSHLSGCLQERRSRPMPQRLSGRSIPGWCPAARLEHYPYPFCGPNARGWAPAPRSPPRSRWTLTPAGHVAGGKGRYGCCLPLDRRLR
jgi:hypothetical protein